MGVCVSCRRRERKAPEKRSVPGAGGPAKGAAAELLPRRVNRLTAMANSMSNIKMTNPIKGIVSKRRIRYTKHGFNLDLAYITDRLIAMGFPAEKLEAVYRNHIDEVNRFLEKMHKDHYKIYNLCWERSYDSSKFQGNVAKYAFKDHMPPNIELIQPFCEDVHKWLSTDSRNVAAVHCKAGKGRTGTMVCCYLLYSGQMATADEALKFYGTKRTLDEKGVTIPSQRRYVEYYAALLRSGVQYRATKVHVRSLVLSPAPPALNGSHSAPELAISQAHPPFKTPSGCQEVSRTETGLRVHLTHCTPLYGDVRVDVYNKPKLKMGKEKMFHFWFNTFFVASELAEGAQRVTPLPDSQYRPNLETFKLTLNKWQLDDAHKDKQHKNYSPDFKVELIIQKMPESSRFVAHAESRAASAASSSASSCSEPDTEPDAHWDSGEHARPRVRACWRDFSGRFADHGRQRTDGA
ncbi:phosphatidylinositol 3,4,5-trisphosphate 3-phosphatase and dual-specificity protein phosphatase PTEN isoform X1 [Manduca sexta]|uniref:phosphatidylinositol 3,4,5-trisphosphate 3-phosphatase and dual-specificity protein phosphatase PTEN isoform X1 n=1 Tax=Manduca sexta TaxID=7130 RepID=UPI00188FBA9E|nr:phosphatidylinositol 3,4,5-trisphosphate 3-phosphatase and dual-specificity protein phosphatase PTEN isoform X1 [Manduca sexta]